MVNLDSIKMYTVQEAAEMLGASDNTIRRYIKGGLLKARKIKRAWLITEESLKALVLGDEDPEG